MADEYKTYDDDKCIGKTAPSVELVQFLQGPKKDLDPSKVNVVYFLTKMEKGAYQNNDEMTDIFNKHKDSVSFTAIMTDPELDTCDKFVKKSANGEITDLNTGKPYRIEYPIAWDEGKKTYNMYKTANGGVLSPYQAFIIDKSGKIVWRQQVVQKYPFATTDFEAQLANVPALEKNQRQVRHRGLRQRRGRQLLPARRRRGHAVARHAVLRRGPGQRLRRQGI